jgi:hypothetical protein
MGTLIAMRYPTILFADQADHTYVKCGPGGKAWSCWGGKTGGTELNRGAGFTKRADAIAEKDERAGITCYLINGVCHQAANRILLPAQITVRNARGYSLSEAIFGTYGRLGVWPCRSIFDQHPDMSGDLPECAESSKTPLTASLKAISPVERKRELKYLQGVLEIYGGPTGQAARMTRALKPADIENLHVKLFLHMAEYKLQSDFSKAVAGKLRTVRADTERFRLKMEERYSNDEMTIKDFISGFNKETIDFQDKLANTLKPTHYEKLFDLKPGDTIILADRKIVKKIYNVEF